MVATPFRVPIRCPIIWRVAPLPDGVEATRDAHEERKNSQRGQNQFHLQSIIHHDESTGGRRKFGELRA